MNVTQTASFPSVTPVFKMKMEYKLGTTEGDTNIILYHDANFTQFTIPVEGTVGGILVDPNNWVLNKTGSITVGIEETDNPLYFTFGPNPAHDYLNLYMANSEGAPVNIHITDLAGCQMLQIQAFGETIKLGISSLPKGSYLLRLSDGEEAFTRRFVKM
jgi:hypothetical protein